MKGLNEILGFMFYHKTLMEYKCILLKGIILRLIPGSTISKIWWIAELERVKMIHCGINPLRKKKGKRKGWLQT